ncbi:MAG: hypothetical protein LUH16_06845 [Clostridiales bacterium]|nr:hypothetical protein [Clostridiales bacterium]
MMVEQEQTEYGWEFLFLGANIDAISTARRFGIDADRAVNFHADGAGVRLNYEAVSCAASCLREGAPLQASWKASIDKDFKSRKSHR